MCNWTNAYYPECCKRSFDWPLYEPVLTSPDADRVDQCLYCTLYSVHCRPSQSLMVNCNSEWQEPESYRRYPRRRRRPTTSRSKTYNFKYATQVSCQFSPLLCTVRSSSSGWNSTLTKVDNRQFVHARASSVVGHMELLNIFTAGWYAVVTRTFCPFHVCNVHANQLFC